MPAWAISFFSLPQASWIWLEPIRPPLYCRLFYLNHCYCVLISMIITYKHMNHIPSLAKKTPIFPNKKRTKSRLGGCRCCHCRPASRPTWSWKAPAYKLEANCWKVSTFIDQTSIFRGVFLQDQPKSQAKTKILFLLANLDIGISNDFKLPWSGSESLQWSLVMIALLENMNESAKLNQK